MRVPATGKEAMCCWGPMMNDVRAYEDGRNFETYGEDPVLSGTMAAAEIPGIQHQGVIATAKHFVCNDQQTERLLVIADIDERTRIRQLLVISNLCQILY
jgi:beta-glucosidase-like glycosyl hydrolase